LATLGHIAASWAASEEFDEQMLERLLLLRDTAAVRFGCCGPRCWSRNNVVFSHNSRPLTCRPPPVPSRPVLSLRLPLHRAWLCCTRSMSCTVTW
jgi:hypothetical protein